MNCISSIKAIIILGSDGKRLIAVYYDEKLQSRSFEKQLFAKTKPKSKEDIIAIEGALVVHKFFIDSHIYVVGSRNETPSLLESVLNCLVDVISNMTNEGNHVDNNSILDNMSKVILVLDEICDAGIILETEPDQIIQRISQTHDDSGESIAQKATKFLFGL